MEFPLAQFLTTSSVFYTLQVIAYIKKKKADSLWLFYTEPSFQTPTWCCRCSSLHARGCCAFCKKFFFIPSGSSFFSPGLFSSNRRVFFWKDQIFYTLLYHRSLSSDNNVSSTTAPRKTLHCDDSRKYIW